MAPHLPLTIIPNIKTSVGIVFGACWLKAELKPHPSDLHSRQYRHAFPDDVSVTAHTHTYSSSPTDSNGAEKFLWPRDKTEVVLSLCNVFLKCFSDTSINGLIVLSVI